MRPAPKRLASAVAALAMLVTGCSASATAGQTAERPPTTLAGYYAQRRPSSASFTTT